MSKNKFLRAATLATALCFNGCGSDTTTPTTPIIPEGVVFEDQVRQLYEESIMAYNPTTGQITFESPEDTQYLQPGNILLADPSPNSPNGLLRKVNSVQNNIVTTSPATLNDAIETCNLETDNIRLTPADKSLAGVGFDFDIPFTNVVLHDQDGNLGTTDDQVRLTGNLAFNSKVTDFKLEVSQSGVQEFNFQTNTTENLSLTLSSDATTNLSRVYQLCPDIHCTPFFLGSLVIKPTIEINAKINGGISISDAYVSQTANLTAGIHYSNRTWTPSSTFTNDFTYQTPSFSENASARVEVEIKTNLLAYDILGFTSGVGGYLRTEVNPTQTPWWKLYGGLEAYLGAKLQLMGWLDIADYSTGVVSLEELIAQASTTNHAPNNATNPSPTNNSTNASVNPLLNWDCSDPDGDSITYDVFLDSQLVADDIVDSQFQLSGLQTNRQYHWMIQAKDSHGLSNTNNATWNFTTSQGTPGNLVIQPGPTDGNDTYIRTRLNTQYSNENHGEETELKLIHDRLYVGGEYVGRDLSRILLQFDVYPRLPTNAEVSSIKISLYGQYYTPGLDPANSFFHKMNHTWSESVATWNNSASYIESPVLSGDIPPEGSQYHSGWHTWDISNYPETLSLMDQYGIALQGIEFEGFELIGTFYSSENPDTEHRPKLEIQYNVK
nr:hypothetical protein [Nanoarchaeum sp.]